MDHANVFVVSVDYSVVFGKDLEPGVKLVQGAKLIYTPYYKSKTETLLVMA